MNTNRDILETVVQGKNLDSETAGRFLTAVMQGEVSEPMLASFVTAMKIKVETGEELLGFAKTLRNTCVKPKIINRSTPILDTCGTGGDGKGSINVSTLSALVISSLGHRVAKHGNRSVSSVSGSSDILSQMGYKIDADHNAVVDHFEKTNFTFLFAPLWHPSMKFAGNVRKELGFRTFFNCIGPLSNPFSPTHQVLGVYETALLEKVSFALLHLGVERAIVCHSEDGLDEFSLFAPTAYRLVEKDKITSHVFDPKELEISIPLKESEILCNTPSEALELSRSVLTGKSPVGMRLVALNAGAGLYVLGVVPSIPVGYRLALDTLESQKTEKYFKNLLVF